MILLADHAQDRHPLDPGDVAHLIATCDRAHEALTQRRARRIADRVAAAIAQADLDPVAIAGRARLAEALA